MPIAGADLGELSGLVTRLAGPGRQDLASALGKISVTVEDSATWWVGEYADKFRRDFAGFVTTTQRGLDQMLVQAARVTRQNLGAIGSATGNGPGGPGGGQLVLAADLGASPPAGSASAAFASDSGSVSVREALEPSAVAYAGFFSSMQSWYRSTSGLWRSAAVLHDHAWGGPTRPGDPPHAPDFGSNSVQEYAKQAYQFLQDAPQKGYDVKVAGSTFRVYDPATNSFGAYRADGSVRTFFQPGNPNYWNNPSFGSAPDPADLQVTAGNAATHVDADVSWFGRAGRLMDTPAGRLGGKALGVFAAAGDVFTLADPAPDALGGPTTERIAAAANLGAMAVTAGPLAGILAANASLDWIPVAGEVVMAATVAYFVGDLIDQNRAAIGHALSWTGHEIVHTGGELVHGLASGASHAWHDIFG